MHFVSSGLEAALSRDLSFPCISLQNTQDKAQERMKMEPLYCIIYKQIRCQLTSTHFQMCVVGGRAFFLQIKIYRFSQTRIKEFITKAKKDPAILFLRIYWKKPKTLIRKDTHIN